MELLQISLQIISLPAKKASLLKIEKSKEKISTWSQKYIVCSAIAN